MKTTEPSNTSYECQEAEQEADEIVRKARTLIDKNRYQESIELLENGALSHSDSPQIWGNLGLAYRGAGDVDQAIVSYRKAVTIDPSVGKFHLYLSMALTRKGCPEEALVEAQIASELNPTDADALCELGGVQIDREAYCAALIPLEKALMLDRNHTRALEATGIAHMRIGEYEQARTLFQRAIQSNPRYRRPWLGLHMVEVATGRWLSAIHAFAKFAFGF